VEQGKELLRLENVQKSYRGHCVLAIERLVLYSGDRIVVTGGNGSGKSTLMRLLAGVALNDRGRVWRAPELSHEILGLVPQSGGLYGELSVEANLHLRRRLYGLPRRQVSSAAFLGDLELIEFCDRSFADLSGGYQRLATLAAALFLGPACLLLDEPLAGLDRSKKERVLKVLRDHDENLNLAIMAAPNPGEYSAANRELMISNGRITCD
jgi:ABC-type multidrug transport system ATPase subunit